MSKLSFTDLPLEMRTMIYYLALAPTQDVFVPGDGLKPRPSLRFRYNNQQPKLCKALDHFQSWKYLGRQGRYNSFRKYGS